MAKRAKDTKDGAEDAVASRITFTVEVPDASHIPLLHVNALNVRFGIDEFFLTLGVAPPPQYRDAAEVPEHPTLEAEPVFRCALSRQNMQKFIDLMVNQFNQQTAMVQKLIEEAAHE